MTIDNIEEYEICLKRGVNPLFWNKCIKLTFGLRVDLQNQLFGHVLLQNNVPKANEKFYRYCWSNSEPICENCSKPLYVNRNLDNAYSATYISHILSRGAHPDLAHDLRNFNILCLRCHDKWENGEKREMLIYWDNQVIIIELKFDYQIQ